MSANDASDWPVVASMKPMNDCDRRVVRGREPARRDRRSRCRSGAGCRRGPTPTAGRRCRPGRRRRRRGRTARSPSPAHTIEASEPRGMPSPYGARRCVAGVVGDDRGRTLLEVGGELLVGLVAAQAAPPGDEGGHGGQLEDLLAGERERGEGRRRRCRQPQQGDVVRREVVAVGRRRVRVAGVHDRLDDRHPLAFAVEGVEARRADEHVGQVVGRRSRRTRSARPSRPSRRGSGCHRRTGPGTRRRRRDGAGPPGRGTRPTSAVVLAVTFAVALEPLWPRRGRRWRGRGGRGRRQARRLATGRRGTCRACQVEPSAPGLPAVRPGCPAAPRAPATMLRGRTRPARRPRALLPTAPGEPVDRGGARSSRRRRRSTTGTSASPPSATGPTAGPGSSTSTGACRGVVDNYAHLSLQRRARRCCRGSTGHHPDVSTAWSPADRARRRRHRPGLQPPDPAAGQRARRPHPGALGAGRLRPPLRPRRPTAMWLPETAVDDAVLARARRGGRAVRRSWRPGQARRCAPRRRRRRWADVTTGRSPPACRTAGATPTAASIDLVFYDGAAVATTSPSRLSGLSSQDARRPGRGGRRPTARRSCVATDGETFGHHHKFADRSLAYAFAHEAPRPRRARCSRLRRAARRGAADRTRCGCTRAPGRAPTASGGGRRTAAARPAASRAGTRRGGRRCGPPSTCCATTASRCSSGAAPTVLRRPVGGPRRLHRRAARRRDAVGTSSPPGTAGRRRRRGAHAARGAAPGPAHVHVVRLVLQRPRRHRDRAGAALRGPAARPARRARRGRRGRSTRVPRRARRRPGRTGPRRAAASTSGTATSCRSRVDAGRVVAHLALLDLLEQREAAAASSAATEVVDHEHRHRRRGGVVGVAGRVELEHRRTAAPLAPTSTPPSASAASRWSAPCARRPTTGRDDDCFARLLDAVAATATGSRPCSGSIDECFGPGEFGLEAAPARGRRRHRGLGRRRRSPTASAPPSSGCGSTTATCSARSPPPATRSRPSCGPRSSSPSAAGCAAPLGVGGRPPTATTSTPPSAAVRDATDAAVGGRSGSASTVAVADARAAGGAGRRRRSPPCGGPSPTPTPTPAVDGRARPPAAAPPARPRRRPRPPPGARRRRPRPLDPATSALRRARRAALGRRRRVATVGRRR